MGKGDENEESVRMCESEMRAAMSWNWRGKPRRIATNHIAIAIAIAIAASIWQLA